MARLIWSCGERPQNWSWRIEVPRAKTGQEKTMWESRRRGLFSMNFPATNRGSVKLISGIVPRLQTRALPCSSHGHGSLYRSTKLNHRTVKSEACAPPQAPGGLLRTI